MIRVLLADDHEIVRLGLRAVLESAEDIEVIGEVATAEAAIAAAQAGGIDVILMDLRFGPGVQGTKLTSGADATAAIRRRMDNPPEVLVVTNYDTDADILGAIEAGALGYMLKDAPPEELLAAVRSAAEGDTALSPTVANRLMSRVRAPRNSLTPRELEVLKLVAGGSSNRDIGRRLLLSEATVKSHLVHIYDKLGVRSRTSAVAIAREQGVL
ncbi:heme-responsive two-component system response HrrA [Corynebacterium diphtheriae bv. mitis]|mgnify:CR=1 FL=1|uniref:Two component system response regulator protein n=3 Tax=Corynebacterium diphtheriae TaxID=1717 RepID=Q6NEK6_CORDI|nr:heme-responsive two-component system response HrrA [Corynebacterium diphtheriae]ERA48968.1 two component system response regulator protein [Corynebacterium diphtheriae DSM 43988]OWN09697.1 LuxR family transcriptional regulator [Corynebacterium belfantii]AEX42956.1 two component system response regulator protein [Corynebacterium diphtheriae 31A]AEX45208.1 two component system response regulator protein [Corynebacterium diphtheriae 241]AEX47402.1 two component system response regulator protei